jgi:DNA invertase Pin-like site-specific DNA recombinase
VEVVYKVDRLTRSLADFAKMVELFDAYHVSFVAVTQPLLSLALLPLSGARLQRKAFSL